MRRTIASFVLLLLFCAFAAAQSKKLWLQYGDESFKQGDYASAAYFYNSILDPNFVEAKEPVFPYELKAVNPPLPPWDTLFHQKKEKDSMALVAADTVKKQVKKEEPKNLATDSRTQYVTYQLAESYRLSYNSEKAEMWYQRALQNPSPQFPNARYWYATCLMKNGKYNDALAQFEEYQKENNNKQSPFYKLATKGEFSCNFALSPKSTQEDVVITEMDTNINSGSTSFALNLFGDNGKIVFTSARKDGHTMGKTPLYAAALEKQPIILDPLYVCDLYTAEKNDSGWAASQNMNSPFNTPQNEGAGALAPGGKEFYFTRWSASPEKKECSIYMSRNINGIWMQPMKLNENVNAEGYRSMQPTFNLDGSIMFFSSDRPGGKGKMDIWACSIDEFGNTGKSFNLNTIINTSEDEVAPYYEYCTQTLYFSSNGHVGLGGLDIFKSYGGEEDTIWTVPINMRAPVNSSHDDSYFVMAHDQKISFFSSDRKSCSSCNGGSCFRTYFTKEASLVIALKGKILRADTQQPIPNSLITFKDVAENMEPFFVITDDSGAYFTLLHEEMDYYLKAQKNKFFADATSISSKGITKSTVLEHDFVLALIPTGEMLISGIEYDYNSATLRPAAKEGLDKLYELLNTNNNLYVELSSHTDSRGGDDYNLKLSEARAQNCVDYLLSKGIKQDHLIAHGYGETKLLVSDEEIDKMKTAEEKEDGHQKNRRTVITILKEDEIKNR